MTRIIVAAAAAVALVHTQTRDSPLPGRGVTAPSGTAVIAGVLTEVSTSRPVRRATLRLSGANGTSVRLAGTNDEGRFVFDALPAGSFTLAATKPGYVPAFHGSKHPGRGPGVPIAVTDGQRVDVALTIAPGAVITGAIVDARGNPAPNVTIAAVAAGPRASGSLPVRATTDDRGVYRIFGLAPGDYLVSALPAIGVAGRLGGAAPAIVGVTDAEARWARAAGTGGAPPPQPGRTVAYAPLFYPGTTDISAAVTVAVAMGKERSGVGLILQMAPTARISGTIIDSSGQAVMPASVALYPRRRNEATPADALVTSGAVTLPRATVSANGFSIPGVAPGEYTMVARSGSATRGAPPPPGAPTLWSVSDLTVDGTDQSNLVLRLLPGLKLSGSIVFEAASLTPPSDLSAMDLSLQAIGSSLGTASTPRATMTANGGFAFSGIAPWTYTVKATPPGGARGAQWMLKSAMLNGRDLADGAFEVKPGADVTGLIITFTDRAAEIAGRLVDAGGRPITRYSIVVFPADRTLWVLNSRRVRSAQPATDGSFTVAGLPAGEYGIAAAEDVDAADLADPAFLGELLKSAFRIRLADGERKRQDLRIGR